MHMLAFSLSYVTRETSEYYTYLITFGAGSDGSARQATDVLSFSNVAGLSPSYCHGLLPSIDALQYLFDVIGL